jgi:excisionase family DNA binding protein
MRDAYQSSAVALSISDMIERYNLSRSTINRHLASGSLRARKLGRKTLIDTVEAERWFAEATRPAAFTASK